MNNMLTELEAEWKKTQADLEDALQKYLRAIGRADHQNSMVGNRTGTWSTAGWTGSPEAPEINLALFNAQGDLSKFSSRVADTEIRQWIKDCTLWRGTMMVAASKVDSDSALHSLTALAASLDDRIGLLLRAL